MKKELYRNITFNNFFAVLLLNYRFSTLSFTIPSRYPFNFFSYLEYYSVLAIFGNRWMFSIKLFYPSFFAIFFKSPSIRSKNYIGPSSCDSWSLSILLLFVHSMTPQKKSQFFIHLNNSAINRVNSFEFHHS